MPNKYPVSTVKKTLVYSTELTPVFLDKLHCCTFISALLVLEGEQLVTWQQKDRKCKCVRPDDGLKVRLNATNVAVVSAAGVPGERTPQRDETGRRCSKAQIETDHRLYRLLPQSVACNEVFVLHLFTINNETKPQLQPLFSFHKYLWFHAVAGKMLLMIHSDNCEARDHKNVVS